MRWYFSLNDSIAQLNTSVLVDAFLQAHDSGLTDADKEVAKELLTASPMSNRKTSNAGSSRFNYTLRTIRVHLRSRLML